MARKRVLEVVVTGDVDDLNRKLKKGDDQLDKFGKKTRLTASITSKGFHGMRLAATGAIGALGGLTFAIKGAVDAASDINESLTKNQALFGANAKVIERYAKTTATSLGISRGEALRAAGTFGGLFDAIDIGQKKSATMSKRLVTLAADLASFNNASPEEALEALRSGLSGEAEPMRKFNAFLSETRVKAEAASLGIGKTAVDTVKLKAAQESASIAQDRYNIAVQRFGASSIEARTAHVAMTNAQERAKKAASGGNATLTEAQKVQARYSLILKDTAKAQGDFTKTKGGDANQTRILKAQYADLSSELGQKLLPAKLKVTKALNKFIGEMKSGKGAGGDFVDTLKDIRDAAEPIVKWIGRATKNVVEFAKEHPEVTKLAAEVIAVGAAIKTLKFVSATTGFTDLLKAGRWAAKALKRAIIGRAAEAGAEAAVESQAAFSKKSGGWARVGKASGQKMSKGLAAGLIIGIPVFIWQFKDQINKLGDWFKNTGVGKIITAPQKLGNVLGHALGSVIGTNKARGGPIVGHGTGDTVPAWLTPGEHVWTAPEVKAAGGHDAVFAMRELFAPGRVQRFTSGGIVQRANKMDAMDLPYLWGGGHGGSINRGVDCSGAVSYALGVSPRVSGAFMSYGKPGPGSPMDTKIYANPEHVFAVFNGRGWGTSRENPGGGPGWLSYNSRSGFTVRHLEDSAGSTRVGTGNPQESANKEAIQKRIDANADSIGALRDQLARAPRGLAGAVQRDRIQARIRALTATGRHLRSELRGAPSAADRTAAQERSGSRLVNRITAPFAAGIREATRGAATLGTAIEDAGTAYGQTERIFGMTDEDLGTAGGRAHRVSEIAALIALKKKTMGQQKQRAALLRTAIRKLDAELKKLRAARDKAKGAKRAKMNERIKPIIDRRDDLAAELKALGVAIADTALDIGDLAKEAGEVAKTPDTEDTTVSDTQAKIAQAVSDIDLMERAGLITPDQANQMRVATLQAASTGRFGALDQRGLLEVLAQLGDASKAQAEAQAQAAAEVSANTQALRDLQAEVAKQNAIAGSVIGIQLREAQRALGDVIGRELGQRVSNRGFMPGDGSLARL